jgi:hypothetical protein
MNKNMAEASVILPYSKYFSIHLKDDPMMNTLLAAALLSLATAAYAAPEATPPKTAQQNKMVTCNADASGKKGDERKAFMKECLSAAPAKPMTAQQSKMKTCNADADGKKGDDRKAFMKTCLSAK